MEKLTPRGEWMPTPRTRNEPKQRCCAKCRRGVPGYGDLPCGYDLACPNPNCQHAADPK